MIRPSQTLFVAILMVLGCTVGTRDTRSPEQDADGLAALIAEHDAAWNEHEPAALADLFTGDGSLVTPNGDRIEGRPELIELFEKPGRTKATTSVTTIDSVQWLDDDLALIDGTQILEGPAAEVVGRAHVVGVAKRIGDRWRFVAVRPYQLAEARR